MHAVQWVLAGCLAACSPSVDYDGTEYRCNESGTCPDGYDCVDGFCVDDEGDGGRADAAPIDRPDARGDTFFMLSESSEPELSIPDGFEQGVYDVVSFDTGCTIDDITVDVEIWHNFPGDLRIVLTGPSGTEVDLREFGNSEGGDDIIGTYPSSLEPAETLDAFRGEQGAGAWLLWIADLDDGDDGSLESWGVNLWCH